MDPFDILEIESSSLDHRNFDFQPSEKKAENTLWHLQELAYQANISLLTQAQYRYQEMASQAQAIFHITRQLREEETVKGQISQEIESISQEVNTLLCQLIHGFPIQDLEEETNVFQCINFSKEMFLPEFIKAGTLVEIKGGKNTPLKVDRLVFDIVLHNIFHIILDRLSTNNTLLSEVEVARDGAYLQITFYDDGYEAGDRVHMFKQSQSHILCLRKSKLMKFVCHLGWEITFESNTTSWNKIILAIPLTA